MYKIIVAICTIALLPQTGCQNQSGSSSLKSPLSAGKKSAERDVTINKSNAYNDIFLDSMAVERSIINEKVNDTMSSAMREFYNTRNCSKNVHQSPIKFNLLKGICLCYGYKKNMHYEK